MRQGRDLQVTPSAAVDAADPGIRSPRRSGPAFTRGSTCSGSPLFSLHPGASRWRSVDSEFRCFSGVSMWLCRSVQVPFPLSLNKTHRSARGRVPRAFRISSASRRLMAPRIRGSGSPTRLGPAPGRTAAPEARGPPRAGSRRIVALAPSSAASGSLPLVIYPKTRRTPCVTLAIAPR